VGEDHLKTACSIYGKAVEVMVEFEGEEGDKLSDEEQQQYDILKPTMFINLAAANLKLRSPEGAKKCCNVALMFCNNPSLLLEDLGDTDEDIDLLEPVALPWASIAMKALFRRGKCWQDMGDLQKALDNYRIAQRLSPKEKAIIESIAEVCASLGISVAEDTESPSAPSDPTDPDKGRPNVERKATDLQSTVNGGSCWLRRGTWSQDIEDAVVSFPVSTLLGHLQRPSERSSAADSEGFKKKTRKHGWSIEISRQSILISYIEPTTQGETVFDSLKALELDLQHPVVADASTWTLELGPPSAALSTATAATTATTAAAADAEKAETEGPSVLVLHLAKDLSAFRGSSDDSNGKSSEWHPGCEWWDRYLNLTY
jgi:tetratricopeptide (TPR) repeat protein